ncbi:MAG: NADH-quinone oxidoreductase subunit J [Actinomycetota bacterium]|nr:NADH-quinone oxidoreductase subunit J [Actinomycetota bacterium]
MSDTVNGVAFAILAFASVGGALGVMSSRNVVHAAFWVLEVMLAIAGLYLLLSAEFLALVQVLVYAGAVSVLLLFVIMLTLRRREDAVRPLDGSITALALTVVFGGIIYVGLARYAPVFPPMPDVVPDVAAFGLMLFTPDGGWVLPFEIASLVLLVALVAAVWWSKDGEE